MGPFPPYTLGIPPSTITTVAGTGVDGYEGEGEAATKIPLSMPGDVAVDHQGNLYIATSSSFVRKVDSQGVMTTFAGNLSPEGYSDETGPATAHGLGEVRGLAVDGSDNVYIADVSRHCIRMVSATNGISRRIAGVPSEYWGFSGDGGPATKAELSRPTGLAVDSGGNLYIADQGNNRIRKVDPGGIITTVAGSGSTAQFGKPEFGGDGGPATSALLAHPNDVACDHSGNLYIADGDNYRIRKVQPNGVISTVVGRGPAPWGFLVIGSGHSGGYWGDGGLAILAQLGGVDGIAADDHGNLYLADATNHRVRKADALGIITTLAGTGGNVSAGDGLPSFMASLKQPAGLALDGVGNLYVADSEAHVVRKIKL